VILLQVLSVSGSFAPFYILFQNLAISRGRSDIYLWCNVGQVVLMLALVIGLHSFGMTVMVVAYAVFYILWLLVWQRVARRLIGLRLAETLRDILPFFFIAVAVMLATYYSTLFISSLPLLLGVRIIVAVALHVGLMKLLKVKMLEESWAYLRKKRH
jgi:O-antigen/teichoic acid export membrane protein